MILYIYAFAILIGTIMVIISQIQKKRDGHYTAYSKFLLNVGVFIIVFSLAEKLPDFISAIANACPQHK